MTSKYFFRDLKKVGNNVYKEGRVTYSVCGGYDFFGLLPDFSIYISPEEYKEITNPNLKNNKKKSFHLRTSLERILGKLKSFGENLKNMTDTELLRRYFP